MQIDGPSATSAPEALQELVDGARSELPRLADEAYRATRARIPLYEAGEAVSHEELRQSIEQNLRFLLDGLEGFGGFDGTTDGSAASAASAAATDLATPAETGRRRARAGAPLPEVLRAYRISFGTLWDALAELARARESPLYVDALLAAASWIWLLSDVHAVALTESYRATTAELLLSEQRRRGAIVEAVLTGQLGPETATAEAAALLGLPPDSPLIVVAAETHELAREGIRDVERALAARGIVSAWRLTPALQLGLVAPGTQPLPVVLEVLEQHASARVGVSPPYSRLTETPRALRLARAALATREAGRTARRWVRLFDPSPIAALIAAAPDEAARLADAVLGPVLALPAEDRDLLLSTLQTYLDTDGSAERAGKLLHCHPNTVRYRLRRLQDLTGRSLSDLGDMAQLSAAAFAIRTGGVQTP